MPALALVGGHGLLGTAFPPEAERREVETPAGPIAVLDAGSYVFLQRHGLDGYRPAYLIDHQAHMRALLALGCERVLALASVGSLHREIEVGSFVVPDDFIALHLGLSAFEDERGQIVPGFDRDWREQLIRAWEGHSDVPLRDGGVYWQAIGPRFETPAEIRLIAAHAEVIGMTVAAECILARELGLRYAVVCVVDNLANGVGERELTVEEFEAGKAANRKRLLPALEAVLPALAER